MISLEQRASMLYWWPLVAPLKGTILMPTTEIIPFDHLDWFVNGPGPDVNEDEGRGFITRVDAACDRMGYPVFIRNDHTAGKHSYKDTCYVAYKDDLHHNLFAVIEDAYLHDLEPKAIVVRQFVFLDATFFAFWGELPIATEARVFAEGGQVQCYHHYWPADAIIKPSVDNWRQLLSVQKQRVRKEHRLFIPAAAALSSVLPGSWSLDFARDENGHWWFIDAAPAEVSWHPACMAKKARRTTQ